MARRSNSRASAPSIIFLVLAASAIYRYGCAPSGQQTTTRPRPERTRTSQNPPSRPQTGSSNEGHLLLGNPSKAGPSENNYLLDRDYYAMSYSRSRGSANWVSWHTDTSDFGDTKRGKFRPDPDLPESWRISPNDYRDSGYDRGHICPSGDRTDSRESNNATFYMSNMMPQAGLLNQKVWADMENDLRDIVRDGNEIYQISGGRGDAGSIGGGKVTIPTHCWKVAVVIPSGSGDLKRIPSEAQIIAVEFKNEENPAYEGADWRKYTTTVDAIERATGCDFLSDLPTTAQAKLESSKYSGR